MFEQVEDMKLWVTMSYAGYLIDLLAIKHVFSDPITIYTFLVPFFLMFITEVPARLVKNHSDNLYTFLLHFLILFYDSLLL